MIELQGSLSLSLSRNPPSVLSLSLVAGGGPRQRAWAAPQEAQLHMARPLLFLGTLLADLALSVLGRQVVLSGLLTVRTVHSQILHTQTRETLSFPACTGLCLVGTDSPSVRGPA